MSIGLTIGPGAIQNGNRVNDLFRNCAREGSRFYRKLSLHFFHSSARMAIAVSIMRTRYCSSANRFFSESTRFDAIAGLSRAYRAI